MGRTSLGDINVRISVQYSNRSENQFGWEGLAADFRFHYLDKVRNEAHLKRGRRERGMATLA